MRAALYLRDPKKDDALLMGLREYARVKGWKPAHTYSGNIRNMLADAKAKKFDVVVFATLDDLSRDGTEATVILLQQLTDIGIRYHSIKMPILSTVDNSVAKEIIAALAKQNEGPDEES